MTEENPNSATPRKPQLRIVSAYLKDRFVEGFAIGLVFMIFAMIDKHGHLTKYVVDLVTVIDPTFALIGVLGAYCYYFNSSKTGYFSRICKSWIDLVQQFITLWFGAFVPLKFGIVLHYSMEGQPYDFSLTKNALEFLFLGIISVLIGGIWILKDEPQHFERITTPILGGGIVIIVLLILYSLSIPDGGASVIQSIVGEIIRKAGS